MDTRKEWAQCAEIYGRGGGPASEGDGDRRGGSRMASCGVSGAIKGVQRWRRMEADSSVPLAGGVIYIKRGTLEESQDVME